MTQNISAIRRTMVRITLPILLLAMHAIPIAVAVWLCRSATPYIGAAAGIVLGVASYFVGFPLLAGALSIPFRHGVVEGRFPRDLGHHVYGPRRLYAACWTTVYYHPAVYHVVLALPWLKTATLRLFGYKGSTNFTVYPDTWIRDLPLLSIGEGAYLSNKATVSPNLCLRDGDILVRPVSIGEDSLVGHATLIAPGVQIAKDAEIGVACSLSVGVIVGSQVRIGHCCQIDRGVRIGAKARIAEACSIGANAQLAPRTRTSFGLTIASKAFITSTTVATALAEAQAVTHGRSGAAMPFERPIISPQTP
jgi:acetyltransferase-like isoleucine patch superfamily enzyme